LVSSADGAVTDVIGNGKAELKDGTFAEASFHMPHGIAAAGDILYVADCENHVIRKIDLKAKKVETLAGTGKQVWSQNGGPAKTASTVIGYPNVQKSLFSFGDVDGKIGTALLQHALACIWHENKLYVADTYNHKIKIVDPAAQTATTFAGDGKPGKDDGKAAK